MRLECGWCHAQKRWSWKVEDFERVVDFSTVEGSSSVLRIWSDQIIFSDLYRQRRIEILNTTRCAARWGWGQHSRVSIGFEEFCLSPCVPKDRNKKLINLFVSETTESACFCICICIVIIDITKLIQHNTTLTGSHPRPTGGFIGGGVLPLWRGADGVFYSPSRQGEKVSRIAI